MTTPHESPLDARSIEALVVKVRTRLDYPEFDGAAGYREAVEALDRLASFAHEARRAVPVSRTFEDDYAAFEQGTRERDSLTLTWHNEFARCPECNCATVGTGVPYSINHASGCTAASRLEDGRV